MANGVNAVAKAANGAIYNVSGALAQLPGQNLVLFKADAAHVSFITPSLSAIPEIGGDVAVILSPVERVSQLVLEEKINAHFTDQAGGWFDVTPALPRTAAGAPVVNRRGELVGVVTLRGDSNNACVIRSANSADGPPLLALFTDATVEFTDSAHAGNKEPDTGQDSFSWTEISLRAFAAIPTRN